MYLITIIITQIIMRQEEQSRLAPSRKGPLTSLGQAPPQFATSQFRNTGNYDEEYFRKDDKLDSEILVERYRDLKQQQKDFLMKINLSTKLKSQIFGFTDMRQAKKPDENQKLVTLIDPFKGRLIMKQRAWLQIQKQKESERIRKQKQINIKIQRENQQKMRKLQREQQKAAKQEMMLRQKFQQQTERSDNNPPKQKDNITNLIFGLFNKDKKQQASQEVKSKKKKIITVQKQQILVQKQKNQEKNKEIKNVRSKKVMKLQKQDDQKNQVFTQYNVKIQGNNQGPNLVSTNQANRGPEKNPQLNLIDAIINQNLKSNNKLVSNQNLTQQMYSSKSKARLNERFKGQNQSQISQIPRKQINEDFSSPDLDDVARIEQQSGEQFIPTKPKIVIKQQTVRSKR